MAFDNGRVNETLISLFLTRFAVLMLCRIAQAVRVWRIARQFFGCDRLQRPAQNRREYFNQPTEKDRPFNMLQEQLQLHTVCWTDPPLVSADETKCATPDHG